MGSESFLFWFLSITVVLSGLMVILFTNPVYCALSLAMTMVGVSALFVTLGAYFIAGVQLIVYAGAVMVLFVMVLMLFDLKAEVQAFASGKIKGALKLISVGLFSGLVIGSILLNQKTNFNISDSVGAISSVVASDSVAAKDPTKLLGFTLFSKHVLSFEFLGVLLTVIAVGTVALARSKGGTHARH